jgi:hypothetical protein
MYYKRQEKNALYGCGGGGGMHRGKGEGCCMEGPSSSVVPCVVVAASATAHSTTKVHLSFRLSNFCEKIMLCRCWNASQHSGIQQQTRQGCHTHFTVLAFRGVAEDTIASILFTTNKFRPARTTLSLSLSRDMLDCVRYYNSSHKIPRALSLSRFSILSTVHKNAFHWALRISWWRQNSSGSLEILDRAPPRFSTVFVNNIRRALTVLTPESFLFSFFCVFFRCVCYLFCSLWCFFWCLKTFFMWSTTAYIVPKGAKKTANCSWDL